MRPLIAICVPVPSASKATLSASWVLSLLNLWYRTGSLYDVELIFDSAVGFGYSRNRLVEKALTPHPRSADYIFWLDSDVELPEDAILRMMRHEKQIVSAMYWSKRLEEFPIAYEFPEGGHSEPIVEPPGKLFKVDAVGMGACLVKGSVYAALIRNIPSDENIHHDRPWRITAGERDRYNFYAQNEDEEGHLEGEDIYWCRLVGKWTKAQIWVDPTIETKHTGEAAATWDGKEQRREMV